MGKLNYIQVTNPLFTGTLQIAVSLGLCFNAASQSAASFNPKETPSEVPAAPSDDPVPAAQALDSDPEPIPAPAPAVKETGPVGAIPSRFVGEADFAAYVKSNSSTLSAGTRVTDPFGQYQDPDTKPVIKAPTRKRRARAQPATATPFSDIVQMIHITTIIPKNKCFLIGSRLIKEGETLPIVFRGKTIHVEVVSVTSQQIDFRNLENKDLASLKRNPLPIGMTLGSGKIPAPGRPSGSEKPPLDLDSPNNLQTQSHQNR